MLHATCEGRNLPRAPHEAAMARYKAADDEVANAQAAVQTAQTGFNKSLKTYRALGGKTEFKLP